MAVQDNKNRTITLLIDESDYGLFMSDKAVARSTVERLYGDWAELFPSGMPWGWSLNGSDRASKKSGYRLRRILVGGQGYRIRSGFPAARSPTGYGSATAPSRGGASPSRSGGSGSGPSGRSSIAR